jgi:hypothetical protein
MHYRLLIISVLILLGLGKIKIQAQSIYVNEKGGAQFSFSINNIEKISFSTGNIIIDETGGNTDIYSLENLRHLSFFDFVGITEVEQQTTGINLFPNPVKDELTIQLYRGSRSNGMIEVHSLDGLVILKQPINYSDNVYQLNTSNFTKGLYICHINCGTEITTMKFIKH